MVTIATNVDKYNWNLILGINYDTEYEHKYNTVYFKMNDNEYTKKLIYFVKHAMECNTIILPAVQAGIKGVDHKHNDSYPIHSTTFTWFRFLKYYAKENIVFGIYSANVLKEATQACPCFLVPSSNQALSSIPNFYSTQEHLPLFKTAIIVRRKTKHNSNDNVC